MNKKSNPIPSFAPEITAYFAGLFDGEGRITVSRNYSTRSFALTVGLGSTDLSIPDMMHKMYGGWLTSARLSSKVSKKPSREWRATGQVAVEFIRQIFPHMRIKKRQAALAFKFWKITQQKLYSRDNHRVMLRDKLADEITALNKSVWSAGQGVETLKGAPADRRAMSKSTRSD